YATAAAPGFLNFLRWSQLHPGSATELRLAAESVGRGGDLLAGAFQSFDQLHIQAERLQLTNQHIEGLGHARFNGRLALHDGFVYLGPAKHIVGLCREQFLQDVRRAVGLERPDFHFPEALAAELRFTSQRLLGDQRVRSNGASVNLVIHQVRKFEHVDITYGYRLLELLSGHAVIEFRLARFRQACFAQHGLDLNLARTIEHRRREVNAVGERLGHIHQFVFVHLGNLFSKRSVLEDALQLATNAFLARVFLQELADTLAQLVAGPSQVRLQDLPYVHTAGYAQRIQNDLHRRAIGQIRHVLFRQYAGDDTLVAVASGHLVAHAQLALHGDVDLHQLDHARRQFVALLQLADALVGDLAQHVDLARGHLFDLVDLLVYARVLVRVLDAFQVARRDALDGLAVQHRALGEQALVGAFVVQVGLHFLAAQNRFQALEPLVSEDSDFVSQVLFQPLDLMSFDRFGTLIFLLTFAGEDLHIDNRALDSRRAGERRVAHISGLFAEDRTQQFFLRGELGFALGRHLAHHDVSLLHRGANPDHATFI